MMLAMNRLAYDAMTVGNHEYNFGRKNFDRARSDAKFPWLSANTVVAAGGREQPFAPYIVKTVGGVKVAVIGITTPAVPTWEKPENLGSYRFESPVAAVQKAIAELRAREHPDLILVASHSGMGRNLATGQDEDPGENVVYEVATKVPELDAIVFGHSHRELEGQTDRQGTGGAAEKLGDLARAARFYDGARGRRALVGDLEKEPAHSGDRANDRGRRHPGDWPALS